MEPITSHLPTEMQVEIFSHLELKSLIRVRCVCSLWRDRLMLSGVHLIRRRLLEMYTTLNKNGIFRASRERSRKVCKPFDRGEYLDCIVKQTRVASIPLEFEIWIQEWPDSAAFDCIWPGLPLDWSEEDVSIRRHGWNLLSHQPPQLYEVYTDRGQAVPALPIWEDYGAKPGYWLILDQKAETYGRVVTLRRTYKVHCYTKEEIDLSTFQMSYRRAPTDEDREQHASERYGLSFLDWLQVALDRYCLGLRDCAEARQYFDKDAQIWRPKIDHNHLNDMPTYRTGGHLMRFTPWRRRAVAPLPQGYQSPKTPWINRTSRLIRYHLSFSIV